MEFFSCLFRNAQSGDSSDKRAKKWFQLVMSIQGFNVLKCSLSFLTLTFVAFNSIATQNRQPKFSLNSTIAYSGVILENPFAEQVFQTSNITSEPPGLECPKTTSEIKIRISKSDRTETVLIEKAKELELLRKLKVGDFLSFQGVRTPEETIKLRNVDFVGLRDLLGTWTGEDGQCYHFKNFTRLIISKRIAKAKCPTLVDGSGFSLTARDFRYFITPNVGSWDVLFSNDQEFFSGEFYFVNSTEIQMSIFESHTGIKIAEFLLRR